MFFIDTPCFLFKTGSQAQVVMLKNRSRGYMLQNGLAAIMQGRKIFPAWKFYSILPLALA